MSHFPTVVINNMSSTTLPSFAPSTSKTAAPLLAKIAQRFQEIKDKRDEDFNNEVQSSLPLTNVSLQPDPSSIPMDFTRHVLELVKENEKLVLKGRKPINLVEEKLRLLRPSKRKYFMVQLLKLKLKDRNSKFDYLELGVDSTEVERCLKASTKPEILKRLNNLGRRQQRSRRNQKRNNMLNINEQMQPCLLDVQKGLGSLIGLNVVSSSPRPQANATTNHLPRKSRACNHEHNKAFPKSMCSIWLPKNMVQDNDILTDSSSCASIKSPCKQDRQVENWSEYSESEVGTNSTEKCKDFKQVMHKKMMQRAKAEMRKEMECQSSISDLEDDEELTFINNQGNAEMKMLSLPSTTNTILSAVYNKERLDNMKKTGQRSMKKCFSQVLLGSSQGSIPSLKSLSKKTTDVNNNSSNPFMSFGSKKLTRLTSLHNIIEERTPKVNDDRSPDSIVEFTEITANQMRSPVTATSKRDATPLNGSTLKKQVSNIRVGNNFTGSRRSSNLKRSSSNNNMSNVSSIASPIKDIHRSESLLKMVAQKMANGSTIASSTKKFVIRSNSKERSLDRTQDSFNRSSTMFNINKKNASPKAFNWSLAHNLGTKAERVAYSNTQNVKIHFNKSHSQKESFNLRLNQKPAVTLIKPANVNNSVSVEKSYNKSMTLNASQKSIVSQGGSCMKGTNYTIDCWKRRRNVNNLGNSMGKVDIKFKNSNALGYLVASQVRSEI